MDFTSLEFLKETYEILTKDPKKRTPEDLSKVFSLTSQISFFTNLTSEKSNDFIHRESCKYLKLRIFNKNDPVFHFGEIGQDFYIVLKGKLGVFMPSQVTKHTSPVTESDLRKSIIQKVFEAANTLTPNPVHQEDPIKHLTNTHLTHFLQNLAKRTEDKLDTKYLKRFGEIQQFKEVASLKQSDFFGEQSLYNDKPRSATVICKEFCVLASLSKSDFSKVLNKEAEKLMEEKAFFLKNFSIFSRIPKSSLLKISNFFSEVIFHKNQFVYKAGDPVDYVYFIKSGEFKIVKWKSFKAKTVLNQGSDVLLKFSNAREVKQGIDIGFSVKFKNEIFGEEEISENLAVREFSVVCVSNIGVLYCISKSDFKQRISNPESKLYLKNRRFFITKRESEIENSENVVIGIRTQDLSKTLNFELFRESEEIEGMKNHLKNLRTKVKKAKILKLFDTKLYMSRPLESRRESVTLPISYPKVVVKRKEKSLEKESQVGNKKMKRVPPPNFMIGMRDLSRFYDEGSKLQVTARRTVSQ